MSTTGKTPVSLLSETLIRQGIQPLYDLQQSAIGVNQGMFVYEVTAKGIVSAVGMGRSKKEAKQDAAKRALEKLKSGEVAVIEPPEELMDPNVDVISPYSDELKENQVGKLILVCEQHNIPPPEFEPIREEGPPHAKHFEYVCKVSAMTATAVGRTKKQAKQLAAQSMLLKLNLGDKEKAEDGLKSKAVPPGVETTISQFNSAKNEKYPLGLKIGQGFLKDWPEEKVEQLQSLKSNPFLMDALELLENICEQLQLAIDIFDVPSKEIGKHLLMLILSTQPESTFLGAGSTEKEAKHEVALQALSYLQIMT